MLVTARSRPAPASLSSPQPRPAVRRGTTGSTDQFAPSASAHVQALTGVVRSNPPNPIERWVVDTYRSMLQRAPTAGEIQAATRTINTLVGQGQHIFAAGAAIVGKIKAGAEYKRQHPLGEWFERQYVTHLGRQPTMEELNKGEDFLQSLTAQGKGFFEALNIGVYCLKVSGESQAFRASHPLAEWTQNTFFDTIGRAATAEELQGSEKIFTVSGNLFAGAAFIQGLLRQKPEFKDQHPFGPWIDGLYQQELGRPASLDELRRSGDFMAKLMGEGKNVFEAGAAVKFCLAQSPEWQARHASVGPDAKRAQIAAWAMAQANDPNIGYSQTAGRFGNVTDGSGHRYFDCSGLVFSAYKAFGVELGGNWTGAMRSTWQRWADQVPKSVSAMKPGDLLLMDGHVVMYTGNGRCVGAQTSHTRFEDQVTTHIDVNHYLWRSDCIVLRPRV